MKTNNTTLGTIWHHIAESNWINFVVVGAVCYAGWLYVSGLHTQIDDKSAQLRQQKAALELVRTQAEVESEVTAIAISALADYMNDRLSNIEQAKEVGNATWTGVRETKY